MTRGLLLFLLLAAQDGLHLPLKEKNLPIPDKDARLAFAFYYSRDESRHRHELHEMGKSGVDVALVLGIPEQLGGLASALEALEREGRERPRLSPAIDPAALKGADLTTDDGRRRLYTLIRGFYSRIPPRAWGMTEGRPLVWLLPPPASLKYGSDLLDALKDLAKDDFDGRRLYFVADVSWRELRADRPFSWGAAHAGPRELPGVSVGPGWRGPGGLRGEGRAHH